MSVVQFVTNLRDFLNVYFTRTDLTTSGTSHSLPPLPLFPTQRPEPTLALLPSRIQPTGTGPIRRVPEPPARRRYRPSVARAR